PTLFRSGWSDAAVRSLAAAVHGGFHRPGRGSGPGARLRLRRPRRAVLNPGLPEKAVPDVDGTYAAAAMVSEQQQSSSRSPGMPRVATAIAVAAWGTALVSLVLTVAVRPPADVGL